MAAPNAAGGAQFAQSWVQADPSQVQVSFSSCSSLITLPEVVEPVRPPNRTAPVVPDTPVADAPAANSRDRPPVEDNCFWVQVQVPVVVLTVSDQVSSWRLFRQLPSQPATGSLPP